MKKIAFNLFVALLLLRLNVSGQLSGNEKIAIDTTIILLIDNEKVRNDIYINPINIKTIDYKPLTIKDKYSYIYVNLKTPLVSLDKIAKNIINCKKYDLVYLLNGIVICDTSNYKVDTTGVELHVFYLDNITYLDSQNKTALVSVFSKKRFTEGKKEDEIIIRGFKGN